MNFLFSKRFMPLFITQYLGAFNDNFLKNAILIMATFQLCKDSTQHIKHKPTWFLPTAKIIFCF